MSALRALLLALLIAPALAQQPAPAPAPAPQPADAKPAPPPTRGELLAFVAAAQKAHPGQRVDVGRRWRNLAGIDLRGAELADIELSRVSLVGADLREARLRGVNFADSLLRGLDASGAELLGCSFGRARLVKAKLRGADLTGSTLFAADARGADFSGANLAEVDLLASDLSGADLTDALLDAARNIDSCKLAGVVGLTPERVRELQRRSRQRERAQRQYPAEEIARQPTRLAVAGGALLLLALMAFVFRRWTAEAPWQWAVAVGGLAIASQLITAFLVWQRPSIGCWTSSWALRAELLIGGLATLSLGFVVLQHAKVTIVERRQRDQLGLLLFLGLPSLLGSCLAMIDLAAWCGRWGIFDAPTS